LSLKGVRAGTREWQLLITDPAIVARLQKAFEEFKNQAKA